MLKCILQCAKPLKHVSWDVYWVKLLQQQMNAGFNGDACECRGP